MATTRALFSVPPKRIFEVLSDPEAYADWVVGSHSIREADSDWPAKGSFLYHRLATGPLKLEDHTEVLESDPPHKLVLRAKARPLGTAIVRIGVEPYEDGARVTMSENAGDPLSHLVLNPLTAVLVNRRNDECLKRLRRIAETGILET